MQYNCELNLTALSITDNTIGFYPINVSSILAGRATNTAVDSKRPIAYNSCIVRNYSSLTSQATDMRPKRRHIETH
jgi:hypothetical protein